MTAQGNLPPDTDLPNTLPKVSVPVPNTKPLISIKSSSQGAGKEKEAITSVKEAKTPEIIAESLPEIEISKEEEQAGVENISGRIELPPDVKKIGVVKTGAQTPVIASTPSVSLPLTDDKILKEVDAPLTSAVKWLAVWCLRKLKKAHLVLKHIHGKIVRVKTP